MDDGTLRATTLNQKRLIRVAGWVLSLAALWFFVRMVLATGLSLPDHSGEEVAGMLALGSLSYAAAVGLLGLSWTNLFNARPSAAIPRTGIAGSYLVSQFAKYLPGNIFQYITRHLSGRQLGLGHAELASAAMVEASLLTGGVLAAAMTLGQPVLGALLPGLPKIPVGLGLCPLLIVPLLAWLPRRGRLLRWIPTYSIGQLALSMAGYLLFVILFGGLFWMILGFVSGTRYAPWGVIGASSTAWLVGFIVPGAPAGAGLREAALAFAPGVLPPSAETLTAIVLFRIATLLGDLLAFVAGLAMSRRAKRDTNTH